MPEIQEPRGRGHPRADWADRCRVWVWYYALKAMRDRSDDELNRLVVPTSAPLPSNRRRKRAESRERLFTRVRHFGSLPKPRYYRGKPRTIMEILDTHRDYRGSARIYDSEFWELLGPTRPSLARIRELIDRYATLRGIRRVSTEEMAVALYLKLSDKVIPKTIAVSSDSILASLARSTDIDALTLVSALYLEAVMISALENAIAYRDVLYNIMHEFVRHHVLERPCQSLLPYLVWRRIICRGGADLTSQEMLDYGLIQSEAWHAASLPRILSAATWETLTNEVDWMKAQLHWLELSPRRTEFFDGFKLLRAEAARRSRLEFRDELLSYQPPETRARTRNRSHQAGKIPLETLRLIKRLKRG